MAQYQNLPGVDISLADGGLVMGDNSVGPRILIIAPNALATAPEEPIRIRQEQELLTRGFGGYYVNGDVNPIAAEWHIAKSTGAQEIFVMALKGASLKDKFLNLHQLFQGILADFRADHVVLAGVTVADEVQVQATDFEDPELQEKFPLVSGVTQIGQVIDGEQMVRLPLEIVLGENDTLTVIDHATGVASDKVVTLEAKVYDGTEGNDLQALVADLTAELGTAVTGLKAIVESGRVKLVGETRFAVKGGALAEALAIPVKVSARQQTSAGNLTVGHFGELLSEYAKTQSLGQSATLAYIGTPKLEGEATLAAVREHAKELLALKTDFSGFLQIVGHELAVNLPGGTTHFVNGASAYAGLVAQLPAQSAPTAKAFRGAIGLRYQYGASQRNALTGHRLVTFYVRNGQVLVTDGITAAPRIFVGNRWVESDYTRLSTMRITNEVSQRVRVACEAYIGEPNQTPQYNSMQASIERVLEEAQFEGIIRDAQFTVAAGLTLGDVEVRLRLVPQFETRRIDVNISLAPTL